MRRRLLLALLVAPSLARAIDEPFVSTDYHPNPAFRPRPRGPLAEERKGGVEQYGEIVILEGDDYLVSDDGSGNAGIVFAGGTQNPVEITRRFFESYPDEFDEVIVFTSFKDEGSPQAMAYEMSMRNDVEGIGKRDNSGRAKFDQSTYWGAKKHRLRGFVNMKWIDQYQRYDHVAITDPRSLMYPVLGQEFSHAWLAFFQYRDGSGNNSYSMLGRDKSHWASTLDADASVQDGVKWRDNGDGTFTVVEQNARFSKLDLYGMGLVAPEDVPPWFLIRDAVDSGGRKIDPASGVPRDLTVRGKRENITIQQVIAALGPRKPAFADSPKGFRVAFLLVTRPGERAGEVIQKAAQLETVRRVWEDAFARYSGGTGTMCTQVSAPCGAPVARVVGGTVVETGGNRNGVIEPSEPVAVTFELHNDGGGVASGVTLAASCPDVEFTDEAEAGDVPVGATVRVTLSGVFSPDGAACGKTLTVVGEARTREHRWRGFVQFTPGTRSAYLARFDDGGGFWGVGLDGKDTAREGTWEWGRPRDYGHWSGYTFQPSAGRGGEGSAWFTGLGRGNIYTGDHHGLGVGKATLWSPRVDLSSAMRPRLRYFAWFVGLDLSNPKQAPTTTQADYLILEATNDQLVWTKLDQVDGEDDRWRQRDIDLQRVFDRGGLRAGLPVQFRFRVNRNEEAELVEAGVDDFEIIADTAACLGAGAPDAGVAPVFPEIPREGGCTVGGRGRSGAWAMLIFACVTLLYYRRRSWR